MLFFPGLPRDLPWSIRYGMNFNSSRRETPCQARGEPSYTTRSNLVRGFSDFMALKPRGITDTSVFHDSRSSKSKPLKITKGLTPKRVKYL